MTDPFGVQTYHRKQLCPYICRSGHFDMFTRVIVSCTYRSKVIYSVVRVYVDESYARVVVLHLFVMSLFYIEFSIVTNCTAQIEDSCRLLQPLSLNFRGCLEILWDLVQIFKHMVLKWLRCGSFILYFFSLRLRYNHKLQSKFFFLLRYNYRLRWLK